MDLPRLAVLCDYLEEGWPSMDLSAEMLCSHLQREHGSVIETERICPTLKRRLHRVPLLRDRARAQNADRLLNRFWDYPRHVRRRVKDFDFFHVCDHSYAQLVHELPAERTGVYCHDLDAFRCLFEPREEPRPRWFRMMARRILHGVQKAAVVFHSTLPVRRQIERLELVDPARLVHAPYGIAVEFTSQLPDSTSISIVHSDGPFLLHVGSCIPRKRIDVLLDVFAGLRGKHPALRLVQVGGEWTAGQRAQLERLGLTSVVRQVRGLDRSALANLYRQAIVVVQPSEAEGFGLPVIEALACGAVVVASDIPVLREVGGDAVLYRPVAALSEWVEILERFLANPGTAPDRSVRLAWAGRFSWPGHARTILQSYQQLLTKRCVA
jgi:glycosyltransferase involved in cell wall biosynthesis